MQRGFLLDVVVGQRSAVLELLASEDESLLVRRNAFFVLYLLLDAVDGVGGLDLQGDGLASECLDEDLHASSQTQYQVQRGFLLDVVVGQGSAVLELLASEDESLLVRRNAFFVLYLVLDAVDGVGGLNLQGDGLASECLDEDLHDFKLIVSNLLLKVL